VRKVAHDSSAVRSLSESVENVEAYFLIGSRECSRFSEVLARLIDKPAQFWIPLDPLQESRPPGFSLKGLGNFGDPNQLLRDPLEGRIQRHGSKLTRKALSFISHDR
jgi:hypothetical protein